jgi:hypothetical protein
MASKKIKFNGDTPLERALKKKNQSLNRPKPNKQNPPSLPGISSTPTALAGNAGVQKAFPAGIISSVTIVVG